MMEAHPAGWRRSWRPMRRRQCSRLSRGRYKLQRALGHAMGKLMRLLPRAPPRRHRGPVDELEQLEKWQKEPSGHTTAPRASCWGRASRVRRALSPDCIVGGSCHVACDWCAVLRYFAVRCWDSWGATVMGASHPGSERSAGWSPVLNTWVSTVPSVSVTCCTSTLSP